MPLLSFLLTIPERKDKCGVTLRTVHTTMPVYYCIGHKPKKSSF